MSLAQPPPVRHPVAMRLLEAALIALVTAAVTSYANQAVMSERLGHLRGDIESSKARVEMIYNDIYCPYGRCSPPLNRGGER